MFWMCRWWLESRNIVGAEGCTLPRADTCEYQKLSGAGLEAVWACRRRMQSALSSSLHVDAALSLSSALPRPIDPTPGDVHPPAAHLHRFSPPGGWSIDLIYAGSIIDRWLCFVELLVQLRWATHSSSRLHVPSALQPQRLFHLLQLGLSDAQFCQDEASFNDKTTYKTVHLREDTMHRICLPPNQSRPMSVVHNHQLLGVMYNLTLGQVKDIGNGRFKPTGLAFSNQTSLLTSTSALIR
ncbi:unnamed protein product [Clonostachys rhizophaga]|uniref:Uncharacterized protein n=1 Tax=Clonostachys rhizophaga TaxID=160324 RepID=A0A9N9YLA6_9HYPO|nr:unnamed protein product [Clonostachys rhizophaga]